MKVSIFLPPGVQVSLIEQIGFYPREVSSDAAQKIEALWKERNTADEMQLDLIDNEIEQIVLCDVAPDPT